MKKQHKIIITLVLIDIIVLLICIILYNQLTKDVQDEEQKKAGFDLTEYKGKKCTLYTYAIKNLIESRKEFYDILISDGKIIGTDKNINRTLS